MTDKLSHLQMSCSIGKFDVEQIYDKDLWIKFYSPDNTFLGSFTISQKVADKLAHELNASLEDLSRRGKRDV